MPSKSGRHHNRNGLRQIKSGSLARRTKRLAERLGIPYIGKAVCSNAKCKVYNPMCEISHCCDKQIP